MKEYFEGYSVVYQSALQDLYFCENSGLQCCLQIWITELILLKKHRLWVTVLYTSLDYRIRTYMCKYLLHYSATVLHVNFYIL